MIDGLDLINSVAHEAISRGLAITKPDGTVGLHPCVYLDLGIMPPDPIPASQVGEYLRRWMKGCKRRKNRSLSGKWYV